MLGTLSTYSNPCKCSHNEKIGRLSNIYLHKGWFSGKKKTGGNLYKCGVGNDFLDGIKVMSHKQKSIN